MSCWFLILACLIQLFEAIGFLHIVDWRKRQPRMFVGPLILLLSCLYVPTISITSPLLVCCSTRSFDKSLKQSDTAQEGKVCMQERVCRLDPDQSTFVEWHLACAASALHLQHLGLERMDRFWRLIPQGCMHNDRCTSMGLFGGNAKIVLHFPFECV